VFRAHQSREPTCGGPTKGSGIGFIIEYFLIVINIAFVNLKIIKPKYPVACSRSVGAAGEQVLLWSMIWCCGGSACTQCLSCATPVVIGTSSMNETCDPVSIRGPGFRSGVQGPRSGFCDRWGLALQAFLVLGPSFDPGSRVPGPESRVPGSESKVPGLVFVTGGGIDLSMIQLVVDRTHKQCKSVDRIPPPARPQPERNSLVSRLTETEKSVKVQGVRLSGGGRSRLRTRVNAAWHHTSGPRAILPSVAILAQAWSCLACPSLVQSFFPCPVTRDRKSCSRCPPPLRLRRVV
jgi:hypothetical protein